MPEIQLGAHTFRTHGAQVARFHMHDWLILFLLVAIDIILNVIEPFHRFVGQDMMTDLKYPLKDNTIPFWAVPIVGIILPLTIILVFYFIRRDVYDLHHALLGNVQCTGLKGVIKEGHKSFPSGHTSWSFAGLGFLALYLSGKIRVFDRRGHVAKLCLVFFPLLMAALVGVSRVDDYWHHWQDVFAGGLLGLAVASFCYLQFFPPPYDIDGWAPHAYLNMVAESQSENRASTNHGSHLTVRESEFETVQV
ncbi:lipid phosphate phosphatase 2-like isoform X2 [Salvia splendens]|uniref:lipid phosphate phosphatase 2-like isoform X2 n=1 Tax=Salvia splendens TaxID=180675 RepID=UPI001C26926D|nr:lipid phosphate phosphatase 2-like isoform X2 [Salvia splendens]